MTSAVGCAGNISNGSPRAAMSWFWTQTWPACLPIQNQLTRRYARWRALSKTKRKRLNRNELYFPETRRTQLYADEPAPLIRDTLTMRTSMLAVSAVTFMIASISACKHRVSFETSSNPPSATQSSTQDRFTDEIQGDMQRKLKAIRSPGWSISSDSNSITLTRNEKAFIFSS